MSRLPGGGDLATGTVAGGDFIEFIDISDNYLKKKVAVTDLTDAAGAQASQTITTLSTTTIEGIGDTNTTIVFGDDSIVGGAGGVEFWRMVETTQDVMTFNNGAVDVDYTFKKLTSGNWLTYDAGANAVTFDGTTVGITGAITATGALTQTTGAVIINNGATDNDFTAKKLTSGNWLNYDAGTALLTVGGNVTFEDGAFDVDLASHDGTNGLKLGGTLVTSAAAELNVLDTSAGSPGTLAVLTGVTSTTQRFGNKYISKFTLAAYSLDVTDAAGSGSHGAVKLMDFPEGFIAVHKCSQVYSVFTADGTGVTAVAAFDIGVGSVLKAAAADGALGGANDDDIGGEIAVTLGSTTLPVTLITTPTAVLDGSAASVDIALNWSGSAATVDANGTIAITGFIEVEWSLLGDD